MQMAPEQRMNRTDLREEVGFFWYKFGSRLFVDLPVWTVLNCERFCEGVCSRVHVTLRSSKWHDQFIFQLWMHIYFKWLQYDERNLYPCMNHFKIKVKTCLNILSKPTSNLGLLANQNENHISQDVGSDPGDVLYLHPCWTSRKISKVMFHMCMSLQHSICGPTMTSECTTIWPLKVFFLLLGGGWSLYGEVGSN